MKRTIAAIIIIIVGILLYFVFVPFSTSARQDSDADLTMEEQLMSKGEIVTLVRQQSRLYSVEQRAHKRIVLSTTERDSISTLLGTLKWTRPWSKTHMEIPVTVTYKAYIDFDKLDDDDIRVNPDSSITVILPKPVIELTSCEIDHNTEVYDRQIFASQKSQEFINRHVAAGVADVWREIDRGHKEQMLASAKENANKVIANALLNSGYKKVNIEYRQGLDINSLSVDMDKAVGNIRY